MNKVEHFAHDLHQRSANSIALQAVLKSTAGRQVLGLGRRVVRQYYERCGADGRFDWQGSTELLASEAIRRGAMQKQTELKGLLDLLSNQHPKNLLEIGTARGGMFFALAHIATSTATLISVDLPGGAFGGGYGKRGGQRLHSYTLPTQRLHLFRANSHDLDTQVQVAESLDGQLLDFLMIDGDHTREGARQDWQTYAPLVRAGGMVVFHDITPNATDPRCQVPELWQELSQSYTSLEIIEPPRQNGAGRWGGIGVLTI